eukprot:4209665-Amphidinium_carterae.1
MQVLQSAEFVSQGHDSGKLVALTTIANAKTIERDNFIPTLAKDDTKLYTWWMVLTRSQFKQYRNKGTIPAYKDSRGDNAHRHQRMHNLPECAINLAIHTRWNTVARDTCNDEIQMYFLCRRHTMPYNALHSDKVGTFREVTFQHLLQTSQKHWH